MTLLLMAALAFGSGYMTRRWHRPVGFVPHRVEGTEIVLSGGQPYRSLIVRSASMMDVATITETLRTMRDHTESATL